MAREQRKRREKKSKKANRGKNKMSTTGLKVIRIYRNQREKVYTGQRNTQKD